jgi:hypothetical protein
MHYAEEVGLQAVYQRILEFQRIHGANWEPSPLLAQLAEQGSSFSAWDSTRSASRTAANDADAQHA